MKTFSLHKDNRSIGWKVIDATNQSLGRIASYASYILEGKNKCDYTPNLDNGDHVIIINADKVKLTGNKTNDKTYYRHTGYLGGLVTEKYNDIGSVRAIELAILRMLKKNRTRKLLINKLHIYQGDKHPHTIPRSK